jgi:hypothetical protein
MEKAFHVLTKNPEGGDFARPSNPPLRFAEQDAHRFFCGPLQWTSRDTVRPICGEAHEDARQRVPQLFGCCTRLLPVW